MDLITMPDGSQAPATPLNLRRRLKYDSSSPSLQTTLLETYPNEPEFSERDLQHILIQERTRFELELRNLRDQIEFQVSQQATFLSNPAPTNPAPTNSNPAPAISKPANPAPANSNPAPTNSNPAPANPNPAPTSPNTELNRHFIQSELPTDYRNSAFGAGDPETNIVADFADCFQLDSALENRKEGIHTLFESFAHMSKRYPCLREPFSAVSQGVSLKYALNRFEGMLRAMKRPSESTTAVFSILAMDSFCPEISHKIRFCLLAASSRTHQQRTDIANQDSAFPAMDQIFNKIPFRLLPGIREVTEGTHSLTTLVQFAVRGITHIDDPYGRFETALDKFNNLDGSGHTDCLLLFSEMSTLFNACTS